MPLPRNRRIGLVVVALMVTTGVGSIAAVRAAVSADSAHREPTNLYGQTRSQSVTAVVTRLHEFGVESATLVPSADGDKRPHLRVQVAGSEDSVERTWLGGLAVGAIADSIRDDERLISDVVSGGTVTSANGAEIDLGGSSNRGGQQLDSALEEEIGARIDSAATRFGLRVAKVAFLHPLGTAAQVTLVVPADLTPDWALDQLRSAIAGTPTDLDGLYLRLEDSNGALLLENGVTYRYGGGGLEAADGQEVRFSAIEGGLGVIDPGK